MLFLRTVTYGPSYEFTAKHMCENGKEHSYAADVDAMINQMSILDPTMVEELYTVKLSNGQVVKLRPNVYEQTLDIIKLNENKNEITSDDEKRNLKMMLLGIIKSVDGISDPKLIEEWVDQITKPMVNRIGKKIEALADWGVNLQWKCVCKDCNTEFTVDIPINPVSFFIE